MYGVQRCIAGYSGGSQLNPTYFDMKDHTESVLIEYDKNLISYQDILEKWKVISGTPYPTKLQYRVAIFYLNKKQENIAKMFCDGIQHVDVEQATKFYLAEQRHQNFLARNG